MQTIYLDISNKGVIPAIYAKQGDVGRRFEVFLTDSGLPYVPAPGSAFSVWYSGASGEGNYTDIGDKSAFSVNGNKVAVELISQMLSSCGDGVLSLVLNDPNGNQISTWNIPYVCESVPGANSEEAKSYYTAFSKAVEGLPYPDASLSVPGKAADAAAVGAALAGKAPAGYGLGALCQEIPDWNSATKCGFYSAVTNSPDGERWYGYVYADVYGAIHQVVSKAYANDNLVCSRSYYGGEYGPWEWDNPPMIPSVEYRTTERHNGKAVYRKAVTYELSASIGTGGVLVPHNISSFGELVRITGNASSRPFPVLYGGTETTTIYNVDGSNISVVGNNSDMGACTMYFDIAYTKA